MLEFGEYLTLGDALVVSAISIIVVFAVLTLIAFIISLIGKTVKSEKPVAEQSNKASLPTKVNKEIQQRVDLSAVVKDEHKLVAMIVATIAANEKDEDKKYKITSIREI